MTYIKLPVDYTKLKSYQKKIIREEYVRVQNGLCAFCKNHLSGPAVEKVTSKPINKKLFPAGFFNTPAHLHHDHNMLPGERYFKDTMKVFGVKRSSRVFVYDQDMGQWASRCYWIFRVYGHENI
jgi:hypothetical protein